MSSYAQTDFTTAKINATNLNKAENGLKAAFDENNYYMNGATGIILYFPVATVPSQFLKMNGAWVSQSAYAALYAAPNVTWVTRPDNGGEFQIPDLRGVFIRGWTTGRTIGDYQADVFKTHKHQVTDDTGIGTSGSAAMSGGSTTRLDGTTTTQRTVSGGGGVSETRPKNMALIACIRY